MSLRDPRVTWSRPNLQGKSNADFDIGVASKQFLTRNAIFSIDAAEPISKRLSLVLSNSTIRSIESKELGNVNG
jgi:hypothetical protein